MSKRWYWFIFVLILALAVFLRLYNLGDVPYALYWDEIAMLVDARAISETGMDMHGNHWFQAIFPSYGDYKLPVYIWLASLAVKIHGVSEWAVRLPSVLAGLGTLLISGGIISELFSKLKSKKKNLLILLTVLVLAISPWAIMFSRVAFEGHLAQFLVASSILLLFKSRSVKKSWLILPAILLGSLATYTYFSVRFVWPVLFLAYFILFGKGKEKLKNLVFMVLGIGIYFATLYPMTLSPYYVDSNQFRLSTSSVLNAKDWALESNIYREESGNKPADRFVYHRQVLMVKELAKNYSDNLSLSFLFIDGDQNLRHGTTQHGLFLWIFLPFLFIGLYGLGKNNPKTLAFLGIWWIIALLPASVPEETPHALRSLNSLVPIALFIGYGLFNFTNWLFKQKNIFKKVMLGIGLFGLIGLATFEFGNYYFNIYPDQSSSNWQDGYKETASLIWDKHEEGVDIWVEPFDDRFYLWLMAYDMSAAEYKNLDYINFKPKTFGNREVESKINLQSPAWKEIKNVSSKFLVVGQKTQIDSRLEEASLMPNSYEIIKNKAGEEEFVMIGFEK